MRARTDDDLLPFFHSKDTSCKVSGAEPSISPQNARGITEDEEEVSEAIVMES